MTWTRWVGNPGGGGSTDGPGSVARLYAKGVVKDSKGNIFFCDDTLGLIRKLSPAGEVSTVAGTPGAWGFTNGTGVNATFRDPRALAIDANDNLYVADWGNHAIRKITPAGVVSTFAGGAPLPHWQDGPQLSVACNYPEGVAVGANGVVYVSTGDHVIRKIENGMMTTFAGSHGTSGATDATGTAARFDTPRGLAVDPSGNVWVASNGYVRKITPSRVVTSVGRGGGYIDGSYSIARFNEPHHVAAAPNGDVYVTDYFNGKIRKITSTTVSTLVTTGGEGLFFDLITSDLLVANGIAINRVSTLYGTVIKIAGQSYSGTYVDGSLADARFGAVYDIATDATGNLYAADANNCAIRKITPQGDVTTLVGVPGSCAAVDGPAATARLGNIQGLDVDQTTGDIYVAEIWNNLIRKITPDGTVTTIAGIAGTGGYADGAAAQARFNQPSDVLYLPNGDIIVSDNGNELIRKISGGVVSTLAGSLNVNAQVDGTGSAARFWSPIQLAYFNGDIYITDSTRIRKMTQSGTVTTPAGSSNGPNDGCGFSAQFYAPRGITATATALYVVDLQAFTIRRMVPNANATSLCVSTIGGVYDQPGSEEGTGSVARFSGLSGIAADANGTLYAASFSSIRKGTTAISDSATVTPTSGPKGTPFSLNVNGTASNGWNWTIVTRPGHSDPAASQLSDPSVKNPTFTPDADGRYVFSVHAMGATSSSITRATYFAMCTTPPAPSIAVTAGTNPSCNGGSVTLDAGAGYSSYLWSTGATTQTITVTPAATTTYTVRGYQGTCESAQASHTQNVSTAVTAVNVTVSGSPNVCVNGTSGTATAADTGGPAATHQWGYRTVSGGTITDISAETGTSYVITASHFPGPGTYYLVTTALGCGSPVVSNEIAVTVGTPQAATITASGPTAICPGGGVTLTANAGSSYLWSTGATSQSITVTQAGNYNVAVTDANNCTTTSADTTVTLRTGGTVPTISFTPASVCPNGLSASASVPNDYVLYAWTIANGELLTPADGSSITFRATSTDPVQLTVNVTDGGGCSATASVSVPIRTLAAPEITFTPASLCPNGATGQASAPEGFSAYQWTITNGEFTTPDTFMSVNFRATSTDPVQLTLEVMDAGGCRATNSVAVPIRTLPPPEITFAPESLCPNGPSVSASAPEGFYSYLWTISNGEFLSPPTFQSINFRATTNDPVQLTVEVMDGGGCRATNSITIPIRTLPPPEITVLSESLCPNGPSVSASAPEGFYTYLWTIANGEFLSPPTFQSVNFHATTNDPVQLTVEVMDGGGCRATNSVTIPIRTLPPPAITFMPESLCTNGTSGTASVPEGFYTYLWTITNGEFTTPNTFHSVSFRATTNDPVQLTVEVMDGGGCRAIAATTVPIRTLPAPTITFMPESLCTNGTSGTASVPEGFYTYLWTITNGEFTTPNTFHSVSFRATTNDPVQLTVEVMDGGGCRAIANTTVPIRTLPAPTITFMPESLCTNGTSGTASVAEGFYTYLWTIANGEFTTPNTFHSVSFRATTTDPVQLTVEVMDGGGCRAIASTAVPIRTLQAPTISFTPASVCPNGTPGTAEVSSGFAFYSWTIVNGELTTPADGYAVGFRATSTSPVQLTVEVGDSAGCRAIATTSVPIRTLAAPSITAPSSVCPNATGSASVPAGFSFYSWTISGGTFTTPTNAEAVGFTANGSGTVLLTVEVGDFGGCRSTATANVAISTPPDATITASGPTAICEGGSVTLTAPDGLTYLWSNGATTRSITVNAAGNFSVTVTNAAGCSATSSVVGVTTLARPNPTIHAANIYTAMAPVEKTDTSFTFCGPATINLFVTQPYAAYSWSTGATTASIQVTQSGVYTLTVTDANGCTGTATATITINNATRPTVTASGPTSFCTGGSVTLTSSPASSYSWSTGETTQSIVVTQSGSYSVATWDGNNCPSGSLSTNVTVYDNPKPVITPAATTFCAGSGTTLAASDGAAWLWSNDATTQSISITEGGTYTVQVTTANGCVNTSDPVTITKSQPTATITPSGPTTFCEGGSVTLTANSGTSYLWSNGATTQSITVSDTATVYVMVMNADGCQAASSAVQVTENPLPAGSIAPSGPTTFCAGGSVTLTATGGSSWLWSNGATTPSITVTESGNYSVTMTSEAGCSSNAGPVAVTVNPVPSATITPSGPTTFCDGGNVTLTASAGSSYAWSNGATTQSIVVSQSGNYSVTVTNASGCSAQSSPVSVTVNAVPSATITPSGPTTFCDGGSVTLTASASSSYAWSNGATTQSITVNASGSYFVTVTNASGCSAQSAPVAVTVNPQPSATITPSGPTTFCDGGNVTLTASAGSSYAWSNGATTQSITVNASGSYFVTVTNASGCSAQSSAVSVTVNPLPAATITPSGPTTFCAGGSVTLTASAGASYAWSNGATTQSITVNASGSYFVTVTNANGCSAQSGPATVTVNPLPAATITPSGPTTFCEGGNVTLSASAGSSYAWSNGATTQSITVSQSGNYSVTVTNASGCSAQSAPVSVTVNPLPAPTIAPSGPTTFCAGGSVTLTASAGSAYAWSNGATTQSITVNASGSYFVTVTNGSGCSAQSAPTTVTVNPLPSATITPSGPTTFCQGGSVTLTASAGSSYAWSNGATTQSITVNASGSYHVTVTNANGCSAQSAPTTVTVNQPPAATIAPSGPTTFCEGGNVTLTASAGASWLWSTGATTQSITVGAAGSYFVTVTNASGCSAQSAPTTVTTNPLPAATIAPNGPTTFCQGGNVTLTASAGSSWLWSNGATSQSITVNAPGSYHVTVTNANGCSAQSAPATVTVNALPAATITPNGPTTFCQGGNVTLTASAGTSWLWSNGATSQSITVSAAGSYHVTVTNANGCSAQSAPTTVTVNALPTATITPNGPTTFCQGGNVTLIASAGASYLWSNGSTAQSITVSAAGNYHVTVTNANGCSAQSAPATVTINAAPAQPAIAAGGPVTFCDGGSVTLTATAASAYFWSNGATSQSITVDASGTFTVQVANAQGCWSVPSAATAVTENARPVVNAPSPATQSVRKNQAPATITVTSTGGATYQWYVTTTPNVPGSGTAVPGANTQSLVPDTRDRGTFYYYLRVTSSSGCVTNSTIATVNVT